MALAWMNYLETGIKSLDSQHKELFRRINGLLDAISENVGAEEAVDLLDFLDNYVIFHFGDEERLMKTYDYPMSAAHMSEHEVFKKDISAIRTKIRNGVNLLDILNVSEQTTNWLINHIGKRDRELGEFLRSRMQAGASG